MCSIVFTGIMKQNKYSIILVIRRLIVLNIQQCVTIQCTAHSLSGLHFTRCEIFSSIHRILCSVLLALMIQLFIY